MPAPPAWPHSIGAAGRSWGGGWAPCFLQVQQPQPPSYALRGWCWECSQVSAVQPRWSCCLSQTGTLAVLGTVMGEGWQGGSPPRGAQPPPHPPTL